MSPSAVPPLDGSFRVLPGFVDYHHVHNPELPVFQFARDGSDDVASVSFREFARATHRIAHAVRPKGTGKDREVVALIAHCDTILYIPLMVGMIRAGFVPFPISPRNSTAAIYNMLEKTSCHRLLTNASILQPLIDGCNTEFTAKGYELHIEEIPTLSQAYPKLGEESAADPFVEYPPLEYEPAMDDVCLYLHSSGSTGFPKPIPQTHRTILHWCSFPSVTESRYHPRPVIWGSMMLPSFHTLGIYMQLYAPLVSGEAVVTFPPKAPAPPVMPNPQNTLEHCRRGGATAVVVVPAFLEVWAQNLEAVKFLAKMEMVTFAGGPLSSKAGDVYVKNGVKINAGYGGTEFGAPAYMFDIDPENKAPHVLKNPKDWAWMRLSERMKMRWIDQGDGTYELHMLVCTNENHQVSVENLPDVRGYATSDLWEKHPTIEGLWKIVGRTDDVLVLASGEKTVPGPMEGHIGHSPMVQGTLMFGRGRNQVGIIIEPTSEYVIDPKDEKALVEFRNKIWPVVEEANRDAPAFSRLFKEMILVADPARPLPRAAKGTVQRKPTLALYEKEIDALLSATFLRNRIIGALRLSVDVPAKQALSALTQNLVYTNPTIRQLASAVAALVSPATLNGLHDKAPAKAISALIEKYSADFPNPSTSNSNLTSTGGALVLVTGTTGSLGSYILATLLEDSRIAKVYAFNRKSHAGSSVERQKAAFEDRGLPVDLLSSSKVAFLEGDATVQNFGLSAETYEKLHSTVTHVIHNAWRLDFNLSLSSFEPNIRATRNLIDFALTAKSGALVKFLFTSSIAVAQSWDQSKGQYPEEVISEPEYAVGAGYGEGKYVVEQILAKVFEHGLHSTSLRIGQICGGLPKGAWSTSDWVPILVKSSLALGCLPQAKGVVSWIPMHTVASVISDVALASVDVPLALNVVHPHPVEWNSIMGDVAQALSPESSPLPVVPFEEWVAKIEEKALKAEKEDYESIPAIRLLDFFRKLAEADKALQVTDKEDVVEAGGVARFSTAKAEALSEAIRTVGALTSADVKRWAAYWKGKAFI
ncbi:acetyl-CoA synthetase-like protein [Gloeophyllum trabeum ATCC 11539]|uniref:Acetyl-CoA synthetase-like protein n=1 Tax=Gloeophyllum trabeum (strain ATCC 11539 / FP-39264 / Madison 617) TaxID=670483 RepID=S7QEG3_GLOTA|nr:acetyl-CoA synthetase-like protein [Gloeophyllum trabeum ATCC 11539]EPQ57812.1 acetyl-CoA synthetase-like protein [Gloeophyllum trabeum ATCC 11539]